MKKKMDDHLSSIRMGAAPRVVASAGDYEVWHDPRGKRIMVVNTHGKRRENEESFELPVVAFKRLLRELDGEL